MDCAQQNESRYADLLISQYRQATRTSERIQSLLLQEVERNKENLSTVQAQVLQWNTFVFRQLGSKMHQRLYREPQPRKFLSVTAPAPPLMADHIRQLPYGSLRSQKPSVAVVQRELTQTQDIEQLFPDHYRKDKWFGVTAYLIAPLLIRYSYKKQKLEFKFNYVVIDNVTQTYVVTKTSLLKRKANSNYVIHFD